jgi:hypothetical protein
MTAPATGSWGAFQVVRTSGVMLDAGDHVGACAWTRPATGCADFDAFIIQLESALISGNR